MIKLISHDLLVNYHVPKSSADIDVMANRQKEKEKERDSWGEKVRGTYSVPHSA